MSHCRLCRGSPSRRSLSCGNCQRVLQEVAAKYAAIDKARQLVIDIIRRLPNSFQGPAACLSSMTVRAMRRSAQVRNSLRDREKPGAAALGKRWNGQVEGFGPWQRESGGRAHWNQKNMVILIGNS